MFAAWSMPLLAGFALFSTLELAYFLARRFLPSIRLGRLYHLWAVVLAVLIVLTKGGVTQEELLWQMAAAAAALISVPVLFRLFDRLVLRRPWAPGQQPMLPNLARDVLLMVLFVAAGLLVAKEILGQPLGAVLVSSTVLSAVVGLALQDVLKNVFAGMALEFEKPLTRGDWLMLDGTTPAQVMDVSWRSMRLRTNEGVEIFEPNSNISAARLVNYGSGAQPRGFRFQVGLPYEAPPTEVKKALRAAARSVPAALDHPPIAVFLEGFDDSSISYSMRVWTHAVGEMRRFQDEVNTRIWYQLNRRGISIPFPIRTLHVQRSESMAASCRKEVLDRATEILSQVELFQDLDLEIVRELAVAARWQHFDEGEVLVREGAPGDTLFVIESGSAIVTKATEAAARPGTSVEVARLQQGDFFGEGSMLTGEDRSATVRSDRGCVVLALSKESVAPILSGDPAIAEVLSRALASRQTHTAATLEGHLSRLSSSQSNQDSASILSRIRSFFKLT